MSTSSDLHDGYLVPHSGGPAAQPPPECVEELSACLLGFRSPHVVLYAASAIQALQGRSPAHLTSSLLPNGVLPLVGRPEDLQVSGGVRISGLHTCLLHGDQPDRCSAV